MGITEIKKICEVAIKAGDAIMEIYNDPLKFSNVSIKEDQSPLTMADNASHDIIKKRLNDLFPMIPQLSEEGKLVEYDIRKNWQQYWCIDPLDGTKEFIKRNGEFTVNIALIANNQPILGVIYVPEKKILYFGSSEIGAWKQEKDIAPIKLELLQNKTPKVWTAIGSRTHSSIEDENILKKYNVSELISAGSSLKFCLVAENKAQIYCRTGPTMEWDTAAGQGIAESAGAVMTNLDGTQFKYNKESLLNPGFICKIK